MNERNVRISAEKKQKKKNKNHKLQSSAVRVSFDSTYEKYSSPRRINECIPPGACVRITAAYPREVRGQSDEPYASLPVSLNLFPGSKPLPPLPHL